MTIEVAPPLKKQRIHSVEFWRFAFTFILILYHLEIFFAREVRIFPSGTTAVEFFFMIAGFTIAMAAANRIESGETREMTTREAHGMAIDFIKKKLIVIYPILAVSLVIAFVVIPMISALQQPAFGTFVLPGSEPGFWARFLEQINVLISSEWEWLMLVGSPFGLGAVGLEGLTAPILPLWFLTPLLTIGYLYTFLVYRKYDLMMFLTPLIAVVGHIYIGLHSHVSFHFSIQMGIFDAGAMRAVAQMALGISIYQLYTYLKKRDWTLGKKIFLQIIELFAIYRFIMLTYMAGVGYDNFRRIPYVAIIILFAFLNVTFLSNLLNRKFMGKLGKISLPMFIIHHPIAVAYFWLMFRLGTGPGARDLPMFVRRAAGTDEFFRPISLSIGDLVMYALSVIIISLLIQLIIFGIKTGISKYRSRNMAAPATQ